MLVICKYIKSTFTIHSTSSKLCSTPYSERKKIPPHHPDTKKSPQPQLTNVLFFCLLIKLFITQHILIYKIPARSLTSSSSSKLLVTSFSNLNTYGGRAFSVCDPKLWNSFPVEMRNCTSINNFKNKFKTFLSNEHVVHIQLIFNFSVHIFNTLTFVKRPRTSEFWRYKNCNCISNSSKLLFIFTKQSMCGSVLLLGVSKDVLPNRETGFQSLSS